MCILSDMLKVDEVNTTKESSTICIIKNDLENATSLRITLLVRPSYTVHALYNDIGRQLDITTGFKLILIQESSNQIEIQKYRNKTLLDAGIKFKDNYRNIIHVKPDEFNVCESKNCIDATEMMPMNPSSSSSSSIIGCEKQNTIVVAAESSSSNDILANDFILNQTIIGCENQMANVTPLETCFDYDVPTASDTKSYNNRWESNKRLTMQSSGSRSNFGYVGLVNQAMTCYLNSLLQALFMTPEFRNALYEWEFDGEGEIKSIPYQLQKLFLNLQTSSKIAVETTDLTQSFGWDSSEAWQQHDIQELCRILFDALEQKFKQTKHKDLIKSLYEGKMMDYVKCLECSTEKFREDAFLDIPLPVRPFGSQTAYGSVEEAMRGFVQPETLDGNNQYFCEKCNKKCDAHKGLKFTQFPYILTLHLKRFDFDSQTFHRIKLNDKVTFPQTLNLNSFVSELNTICDGGFIQPPNTNVAGSTTSEHGSIESAIKFDDCSTTDSGSALEEDTSNGPNFVNGGGGGGSGLNNTDADSQEDDEGIDMASSATDNKCGASNESGPYMYELFAIMIHSGSASGGHYYVYIKDFDNDEWFCFNDQSVSTVAQEDIEKSFGGGSSTKTYYSSAYSPSTNAYMLMYRQCDPARNVVAIKPPDFPQHICNLLKSLQKAESDRLTRIQDDDQIKLKIFCWNPRTQRMTDTRIYMPLDATLAELLDEAHNRLKINLYAPIERCRLVAYRKYGEKIIQSFDGQEHECLSKLLMKLEPLEMLLEIRDESMPAFEPIPLGSESIQVYQVDMATGDVDGPTAMRILVRKRVADLRALIATKLDVSVDTLHVSLLKCDGVATLFDCDTNSLEVEDVKNKSKIFVTNCPANNFNAKMFTKIVERFEHIITLHFVLPNTDKETLDKMGIPSYEKNDELAQCITPTRHSPNPLQSNYPVDSVDVVDAVLLNKTLPPMRRLTYNENSPIFQHSSVVANCGGGGNGSVVGNSSNGGGIVNGNTTGVEMESNSEDSSLSDGDKTLVESPPELNYISSTNNSPSCSDAHLSSPDDHTAHITFDYDDDQHHHQHHHDDNHHHNGNGSDKFKTRNYYFKAVYYEQPNTDLPSDMQKMLKVLVDSSMIMGNLKLALEPFVKVPKEYFKIFRSQSHAGETECTRLTETLNTFRDNERLIIELGRALRAGEYKCTVYYLKLSEVSDDLEKMPLLCDWILCKGANVGQTKREIIAHLQTLDANKYDIAYDQCRLRKKLGRQPTTYFADDEKFGDDYLLTENYEMIFQIIDNPELMQITYKDVVLFVRQWFPSKMELGKFQEVIINDDNDLKAVLSKQTGIPEDQIEYAKIKSNCLRNDISILNLHTTLNWNSNSQYGSASSTHTGETFFFKDKSEQLKQLTATERSELTSKDHLIYRSMYSPRRERSLKIYLDSPKKRDD